MFLGQNDGHSIVNLCDKFIGFRRDDRAGPDPIGAPWGFPAFPKTGEYERLIIMHRDGKRRPQDAVTLPLVEAIGWNQTSPFLERTPKRGSRIQGLHTGVDGSVPDFFVRGPTWNQAPSQGIQRPLAGFWIKPDGQDFLAGSNVPADRQIRLPRDRDFIPPR